jgi:hypothetical protein
MRAGIGVADLTARYVGCGELGAPDRRRQFTTFTVAEDEGKYDLIAVQRLSAEPYAQCPACNFLINPSNTA